MLRGAGSIGKELMHKLKIILGTTIKGKAVAPGDVVEVDGPDARTLIAQHQAEMYLPPPAPAEPPAPIDYESMKKEELLVKAEELKIDVPEGAKKGEIIELLKAAG